MRCAHCEHRHCFLEGQNCTDLTMEMVKAKHVSGDMDIMRAASCTEARNYMKMTRLEESAEFATLLGAKKIGLAFCLGLAQEAKIISRYFEKTFEVYSVCCKVCGISKEELALEQVAPGKFEAMCNPKIQAELLAKAGTELNFTIGLCVGHDIIFNAASAAPVSCLVVKDRVLAHNPLGAIYSRFWRNKFGIPVKGEV